MSEAFVYCWTDHKTDMLYVGYHKGSEDDGYICSSKYMMKEYISRPEDFSRQIVASGTHADMEQLEHVILESLDARNNPQVYNRSHGRKAYVAQHTEETKRKISMSRTGYQMKELTKQKLSEFQKNLYTGSEGEFRKQTISERHKGKTLSDDHRKALLKANTGRKVSDSTKELISLKRKEYWNSPEGKAERKQRSEMMKNQPSKAHHKLQCPHCERQITVQNMAKHINSKHKEKS